MKKYPNLQLPKWWESIKQGSHGSGKDQKKLWTLASEFVRREEFKKYKKCVSCKRGFDRWQDSQCGHFRAWSVCNGMFKFERKNLAMICSYCNHQSDGPINEAFAVEMNNRYGEGHTDWIVQENAKHSGEKLELPLIVELGKHYKSQIDKLDD